MNFTLGPLIIQPNDRGDGIWLKDPGHRNWPSVATVWRAAHGQTADGNAVLMAHAANLYNLVSHLANLPGRNPLIEDAKRELDAIRQEAEDLRAMNATAQDGAQ